MSTVVYKDGQQVCEVCDTNSQTYYTGPGQRVVVTNPVVTYTTEERVVNRPLSTVLGGSTITTTNYVSKDTGSSVVSDSGDLSNFNYLMHF